MPPPAVQAHRGSPDPDSGIAENTLEAFARARRLGAAGVELDVRLTADGALAIHHDPVVGGVPLAELAAAALPPSVPFLREALDACRGMVVNIEIKNLPGDPGFDPSERAAREVAELVVAAGRAPTVVISSFWPATLEAVRSAAPDLVTGLLLASWADPAAAVDAALACGSRALHPHLDLVGEGLVGAAHDAGLAVAAWTVNRPSDLEAAAAAGVDTVITDDVTLARDTLGGSPGG
jgi:glycerophosphoryl diester phosphodiesterase